MAWNEIGQGIEFDRGGLWLTIVNCGSRDVEGCSDKGSGSVQRSSAVAAPKLPAKAVSVVLVRRRRVLPSPNFATTVKYFRPELQIDLSSLLQSICISAHNRNPLPEATGRSCVRLPVYLGPQGSLCVSPTSLSQPL